ncbi:MAG: DUF1629 domain-containing protein [Arenimonas sp.]
MEFIEGFGDANPRQKPRKKGDFHTALSDIRLFSQRAVDVLGSTLTATGKLFRVTIVGRDQPFYWYWCTKVVDCLDEAKTRRGPPSSLPLERRIIMKPAFHADRIGDSEIFVVPGQSRQFDMFVTDAFRAKVESERLKGFKLGISRMDAGAWRS